MIRPYKPSDLETVAEIGNRAWENIYTMFRSVYGDELFSLIRPDEKTSKGDEIRKSCALHPEWVLICERKGAVAGFITFWLDRDKKIGVIGNNAKDPDSLEKGIGREMYLAVLDFFRENGMLYAEVSTGLDEAHAPARRAYEAAGFNIRHEKAAYYRKL